jgi:TetR/AcrR family transcriptional regulator
MTVVERRQREKDMRRDNAIIVASRLFRSKGYENVSMDEIAREAELGKTTLYTYFEDKEALFLAVVNRGIEIFSAIIAEEEERMRAACTKIGLMKTACNRFFLEYPDYANAYIFFRSRKIELLNDEGMNSDVIEIIEFTKMNFEKEILEIKTCIENGVLRSDINPVIVIVLNSLIQDSILTMNFDLRMLLTAHGITLQQFYLEVNNLVQCMIIKTEGGIGKPISNQL